MLSSLRENMNISKACVSLRVFSRVVSYIYLIIQTPLAINLRFFYSWSDKETKIDEGLVRDLTKAFVVDDKSVSVYFFRHIRS